MKVRFKFQDISSRLTGFSTPVFGISWNPPKNDRETARSIVNFLEDRRVLYNPSELESPDHCISSVIEIRRFLSEKLNDVDEKSELAANVRAMRSACRKFLNSDQLLKRGIYFPNRGHDSWVFYSALGEMRGIFGICLSKILLLYGLDIEKELASILPEPDQT